MKDKKVKEPKVKAPKEPKAPKAKTATNSDGAAGGTMTPEDFKEPKVAVIKKKMDVSESVEALGKLREFAAAGVKEDHRELRMAFESLEKELADVETWITTVDSVLLEIAKQEEKTKKALETTKA